MDDERKLKKNKINNQYTPNKNQAFFSESLLYMFLAVGKKKYPLTNRSAYYSVHPQLQSLPNN